MCVCVCIPLFAFLIWPTKMFNFKWHFFKIKFQDGFESSFFYLQDASCGMSRKGSHSETAKKKERNVGNR